MLGFFLSVYILYGIFCCYQTSPRKSWECVIRSEKMRGGKRCEGSLEKGRRLCYLAIELCNSRPDMFGKTYASHGEQHPRCTNDCQLL